MNTWDPYFMSIAYTVATRSKCLSRQLGAILVKENCVIATGYNGPARKVQHCAIECPRKSVGAMSGERLDMCPASHAEANCIAQAARMGVMTRGSQLYLNWVVPCKDCMNLLINAGVSEIVTISNEYYDTLARRIKKESGIVVRKARTI
jgi:dCMP deaminase